MLSRRVVKRVTVKAEQWTRRGASLPYTRYVATCDGGRATAPFSHEVNGKREAVRRLATKLGWDFFHNSIVEISPETFYVDTVE